MSAPKPRVGLVLGASGPRSVGWAIAQQLASDGAEVAITARPARCEGLRDASDEAGFAGLWGVDAAQPETLDACLAELDRRWRRLDFLVHTWMQIPAGVLSQPLRDVRREDFDLAMGAGVFGFVSAASRAQPMLARSAAPRVVTLTSACRRRMTPRYHLAGIAKAALDGALIYVAQELGEHGIACNAVSFSLIATPGAEKVVGVDAAASTSAWLAKKAPLKGGVDGEAVASTVAWLCSPMARGITAETIEVDGGFSKRYF